MNERTKLIFSLPSSTCTEAAANRVRALMGVRFPQFRFEAQGTIVTASERLAVAGVHDVFVVGPWHLSARERPTMESMVMFGEGAAAALYAADGALAIEGQLANEAP